MDTHLVWRLTDAGRDGLATLPQRAARLRAVAGFLDAHSAVFQDAVTEAFDHGADTLRKLEERGYAQRAKEVSTPEDVPLAVRPGPPLNADQQIAVDRIG